ncbi:uncharacterized protein LOC106647378 [Copidosoma floridanum]|uniref:uncharacterized protein LOC106647378 n=1 Tax=Copidosoma floridanum TaxID=29053 RepID=UPI0006C97556|nr:uncharacterized protein LOC106647378 [Copidosoma floridanum]
MRYILLFCVTVLNIGTLKTELIDYSPKNNVRMIGSMLPKFLKIRTESKEREGRDDQQKWNFQPNDPRFRKIQYLNSDSAYGNQERDFAEADYLPIDQLDDTQLTELSIDLLRSLYLPAASQAPPLIAVKADRDDSMEDGPFSVEYNRRRNVSKRARLYMKFPFKRQHSRIYTSPDFDIICSPSRNEIVKLLSVLHNTRNGNKVFVDFCSRRRPTNAVYTNIRFLGRRRR